MDIKNTKQYAIGVDIGGTKMRAVLWNGEKVMADDELATPADTLDHFLVMLKALVDPLLERANTDKVKVAGIGLGVPGVLDSSASVILYPTNTPLLAKVKLAEKCLNLFGLPAVMDNDANCFVRAEAVVGAAKGFKSVFGITVGTGIGGGWFYEGAVFAGGHGGAGQINRLVIDVNGGVSLEEAYHRLAQNNPGKLSQEAILGDPLAEKAFSEMGRILGFGLANVVNIIDPDALVIGGGVVKSSDLFLPELKKVIKSNIDSPETAKKIKIFISKLKQNAGAIGAALLVK